MSEAPRRGRGSDTPLLFAMYHLIYLSVLLRMILRSPDEGNIGAAAYWLMAAFLVLSLARLPLSRRWEPWTHLHLALQCGIVLALFATRPQADFYGLLCVALSIVAGRDLPEGGDLAWLAALCATVCAGLALAFDLASAAGYAPTYLAGCLLVGLYGRATRAAETARERGEALRAELEEANRRLRALAEQSERNATLQERARLSRELHDAATQTVFSLNLTAEAARMSLADPERLPPLLDKMQELSRDALAELRSLVHELRPPTIAEEGLAKALERHAAMRERRDGLRVAVTVRGEERGGLPAKELLFGAAVEALNNVVKHAKISEASLELSFGEDEAALRVRDSGAGFDASAPLPAEHFGLVAMKERAEALRGFLVLRSAPGAGTEVELRIPLGQEEGT